MAEKNIELDSVEVAAAVFGNCDRNIRLLENEFSVTAVCRGTQLRLSGEPANVAAASRAVEGMLAVAEARTLTITPWDRTLLRPISKAIMASDVGITPIDDGSTIRLNFPAPTEERRKQLAKEVSKLGEEAKVAVRNIRREAMDKAKAMKKAGELTEDSQKTMEEDVQKLTDKYIKNIDAAVEEKQKEIMSV